MGGVFEVLVRGLMLGLLGRSFVSTYPDFVPSLLMQGPRVETVLLVLGVAGGIMVYCCVRLWAVGLRFMVVVVGTMIVVSFG